jgi:hypothetical protein
VCRQYSFIQSEPEVIAIITDPLNNNFIDSTFWEGQQCRYWVRINTPAGSLDGEYIWVYTVLSGLKASWHPDGTVDVTWDKARNLESFGSYHVYAFFTTNNILAEQTIYDPDQNYFSFNYGGFAFNLNISLMFIPAGLTPGDLQYLQYTTMRLVPPFTIPNHKASYNVNGRDFILLSSYTRIWRYFPTTSSAEDSINSDLLSSCMLSVSNNGERFVYYSDDKFYVRRTEDFSAVSEFQGPPLQSMNRAMVYYSLSDNGRLTALDNMSVVYYYDTENGILLHQDTVTVDGYRSEVVLISPDGTRMTAHTWNNYNSEILFSYEPEGWIEKGRGPMVPYRIFYSADGTLIYVAGYGTLHVRNGSDFSLVNSYPIASNGYFQSADLENGRFLLRLGSGDKSQIVDLDTGEVIRTVDMGYAGFCMLYRNYVIASYGYQLTIPEF